MTSGKGSIRWEEVEEEEEEEDKGVCGGKVSLVIKYEEGPEGGTLEVCV